MAELQVELTAKISKLLKDLNKAEKELDDLGKAADKAQGKTSSVGSKSATQVGKFTKATANATPTLQEFGRVLSDAPFGIRGIGNNIEQLVSNFGNLSKSAGGSKAAFKSLLAGLTGPGGILIAVSAVTSGLTALSLSGVTLSDVMTFLSGGTSKAAQAQRDLAEASFEALGNAKQEVATLQSLLNVAKNKEESDVTRSRALAKINDEYGEFLPNLTKENVNTKAVTAAVDKYNTSLLRQAKIKGAQNLLSEEFAKILELESKNAIDSANALDILAAGFQSIGNAGFFGANLVQKGFKRQQKEISEAEKRIQSFQSTLQKLLTEDLNVGGIETSVDIKVGKITTPKVLDLAKIFKVDSSQLDGIFVDPVRQQLDKLGLLLDQQPALIEPRLTNIQTKFAEFNQSLENATINLASSVSSGFAQLGQSLANGSGFFQAAGTAILSTLGGIITQIGQAAIAAGIAAISLKNLFSNPVAAIAAGGALVALGSALSAATNSVSGIGGGSTVSGQGSGSFSGSNSSISSGGGSFGNGTVVFEIEGQKLVGILNKTLGRNSRLGGNLELG